MTIDKRIYKYMSIINTHGIEEEENEHAVERKVYLDIKPSPQQSDIAQVAFRFSRFQPNSSRLSRSQSESDPICNFCMVKNDRSVPNLSRICPNSVPILHNASRQIWM